MIKTASNMRFTAKLLRPAATEKAATWTFLRVPREASEKLPTRSMTSVNGTLNAASFQATLEPDGQGSHWLKPSYGTTAGHRSNASHGNAREYWWKFTP
jgi:hypothetical protein